MQHCIDSVVYVVILDTLIPPREKLWLRPKLEVSSNFGGNPLLVWADNRKELNPREQVID